jgi:hypothetical protein
MLTMAPPLAILAVGFVVLRAQAPVVPAVVDFYEAKPADVSNEVRIQHSDCTFFSGAEHERRGRGDDDPRRQYSQSRLTMEVAASLGRLPKGEKVSVENLAASTSLIDRAIFQAIRDANVTPANRTTDTEFIRRVTLDLTGKLPVPERVQSFIADSAPDKRAKLVDELMNSAPFVDKWTMYWGDRFKNTANMRSTGTQRMAEGRDAFYRWIKKQVQENVPFNRTVFDLIAADGINNWDDQNAAINWLIGGRVTGGPNQDIWDQQASNVAETFLGMSHVNCILCHDGRGHLDQLSLWGRGAKRTDAWGLASFFSKTTMRQTRPDPMNVNRFYWGLVETANAADYPLGSTSGNRPARTIANNVRNVAPRYPFSGRGPRSGEDYREALAREVTNDVQFARATVNFIWAQFFGRGLVNPVNQMDPARLDPDNPPNDCPPLVPCQLQASHPRLLQDLALDFQQNNYNLRDLIRKIATSEAYMLSSRYEGRWDARWEPLFARKLIRRLTAEEIADAVVQSTAIPMTWALNDNRVSWAMQLPEPITTGFLGGFLPGNRDDEERKADTTPQQALNMMNDAFVTGRLRATGTGSTASLLQRVMTQAGTNDSEVVNQLYLNVLSRRPDSDEMSQSARLMQTGRGTRTDRAATILWALLNKVDFLFNY